MKSYKKLIAESFINDMEKMDDFYALTKKEFLESYSYITEKEYNNTVYLEEKLFKKG